MAVFNNILAGASGQGGAAAGYEITRSLRFNSGDSAHLIRTPSSSGNRKTWTWSGWVKRSSVATTDQGIFGGTSLATFLRFKSNQLDFVVNGLTHRRTNAVFRDNSAWYHFIWAVDTTQATASNRSRFYVNGVEVTSWSVDNALTQNVDTGVNNASTHVIGATDTTPNDKLDAYIADFYLIDGQQLAATDFGEFDATTGAWNPIAYSGSYGTNGFHLLFDNTSNLGEDSAGSNDWTPNNFSTTAGTGNDSLFDSPTNGTQTDSGAGGEISGNYSCFNPLAKNSATTLRNGNLDVESTGVYTTLSTIGFPSTGKFYAEFTINNTDSGYPFVGIGGLGDAGIDSYSNPNTGAFYATGGYITGSVSVSGLTSLSAGNTVGVAFDASNGKTWFRLNGTWVNSGNPAAGTNQTCTLTADPRTLSWATSTYQNGTVTLNAGQRAFHSNAPSGFKCLCTANFDTPTIEDPSTVMDVALYTGNGSTQTISGLEFSPDLVWIKDRTASGGNWFSDVIRGSTALLRSDSTAAENTVSTSVTGFTSDGFTLGAAGGLNTSGNAHVAWTWDAGTSTASNTSGTITSQVRANISAGFSIVSYTGNGSTSQTIGHGLGVSPMFVLIKNRDANEDWVMWFSGLTVNEYAYLDSTGFRTYSGSWGSLPTSSVFSNFVTHGNTNKYIAYCWAPVEQYSATGEYTGTGTSDGPFIYTGFRPKWLLIKRSNGSSNWYLVDAERDTYNTVNLYLQPQSSSEEIDTSSEGTKNYIDFLSNGFKLRGTEISTNASQEYRYLAFAESPFKYARAR